MGNRFSHIADAGADGGSVAAKPKPFPVDDVAAGTSPHPAVKTFDEDNMLSMKSSQKLEAQGAPNPSGTTKNSQEIASEAIQEACNLVAGQVLELINEPPETFVASHLADVISDKLNEQLEKPGSKFRAKSMKGSCGVGAASASVEWTINETIDKARNITGLATTTDSTAQDSNNIADAILAARERARAAQQVAAKPTNQTTTAASTNPVIGTANPINQQTANTTAANTSLLANNKFKTTCQDRNHCSAARLNTRIDITFGPPKPAAVTPPPPANNNVSPAQINHVQSASSSLHNINNNSIMMTMVLILALHHFFFNTRR